MSPDSDAQAADFVRDKDDIKALTMWPYRATAEFAAALAQAGNGKLIYCHTINDKDELKRLKARGVWGFYTDCFAEFYEFEKHQEW